MTVQYEIETIQVMTQKIKKKDNTFLYIISTVTFIFLGIILTTVIDMTKPNTVGVHASATAGIEATAVVSSVDSETNAIKVDELMFANSSTSLGSWTITPPSSFLFSSIIVGNKIALKIDPAHFDIQSHSLTAKEIKKK